VVYPAISDGLARWRRGEPRPTLLVRVKADSRVNEPEGSVALSQAIGPANFRRRGGFQTHPYNASIRQVL
jgi:hypothetical protein